MHMFPFGSYAIESDLYFSEASTTDVDGYIVNLAVGSNAMRYYDFLEDPAATEYTDIEPGYSADTDYAFQMIAVSTDQVQSSASATQTVNPLEPVDLTQPVQNQGMSNPVLMTWNAVPRAASWTIFIYDQYPTIGTSTPSMTISNISGSATSYQFPKALANGNYWMVLAASDTNAVDVSVSDVTAFYVQN